MGCDIHPVCEFRWSKTSNYWMLAGIPPRDRNYHFFGLLSHVRTEPDHKLAIDGWPENIAAESRFILEQYGDHTPGWVTLQDLVKHKQTTYSGDAAEMVAEWIQFGYDMMKYHHVEDTGSIRFVFNYDN
jgi:hypothetical protein